MGRHGRKHAGNHAIPFARGHAARHLYAQRRREWYRIAELPVQYQSAEAEGGRAERTCLRNTGICFADRDVHRSPSALLSAYSATIDWGDGLPISQGIIQIQSQGANGPVYQILGSHTYAQGGPYQMIVTVMTSDGGVTNDTTTVNVVGLPLTTTSATLQPLAEGDQFLQSDGTPGVLATFKDTAPVNRPSTFYTATITFGDDGSTTTGIIVPDPNPTLGYDVIDGSGHQFGGGSYNVTIEIDKPGLITDVVSTAIVTDSPLSSQGQSVTPVEGTDYTGPIAAFQDADPRHPGISNYFGTIDWGDGTVQAAMIVPNPFGPGFLVEGSHPYGVGSFDVTVSIGNRSGGNTTVALSGATVADAPLIAQGYNFSPSAGVAFNGILASFTDSDPRSNPTSMYSATINWGDGTQGPGQIVVNEDGGYLIKGGHAYGPGSFTITTSIQDIGGAVIQASGTVTVPDAPLSLSLSSGFKPTEGTPYTGVIATFTTPNLISKPTDYGVQIALGDGHKHRRPSGRDRNSGPVPSLGGVGLRQIRHVSRYRNCYERGWHPGPGRGLDLGEWRGDQRPRGARERNLEDRAHRTPRGELRLHQSQRASAGVFGDDRLG